MGLPPLFSPKGRVGVEAPLPNQYLMMLTGSPTPEDFRAAGAEFVGHLRSLAHLRRRHHVLEIGCGSGRIAAPLAEYLSTRGRYDGIDVLAPAIDWCEEHVVPLHPGFRFHHADLYSGLYNPGGKQTTETYRVPLPDASVDVVLLLSLFTHLLPASVEHYLDEIVRVLRPGGRILSTWFILGADARRGMREGRSVFSFTPTEDPCWLYDLSRPELAVAYEEAEVRMLLDVAGLKIVEPIHRGWWFGHAGLFLQDMVVAYR